MVQLSRKQMPLLAIAVTGLLASGAVLLLDLPVVQIDQSASKQIRRGMTVSDAEAIIGGAPGWYDGVSGIRTDAPADKKEYRPTWVGSEGQIIVELDEQGRVAGARFYPALELNRSDSRFVWERLTRNAFGTGRTDLVIEACTGLFV